LIGFGVGEVVDAIEQQSQGKQDERQSEPEPPRVKEVRAAERQKLKQRGGTP